MYVATYITERLVLVISFKYLYFKHRAESLLSIA